MLPHLLSQVRSKNFKTENFHGKNNVDIITAHADNNNTNNKINNKIDKKNNIQVIVKNLMNNPNFQRHYRVVIFRRKR